MGFLVLIRLGACCRWNAKRLANFTPTTVRNNVLPSEFEENYAKPLVYSM